MAMADSQILQPDAELHSVVYRGENDAAYEELVRLADLVGVGITRIAGSDRQDGVLRFSTQNTPEKYVKAEFHPLFAQYFAAGSVLLNYRTESEQILELLVAVGATMRGKVLGILGAHGGAGVSHLAAWIARTLAKNETSVALLDLDPFSAGIELLISGVGLPGKRWPDLHGSGALLAGRLNAALPRWNGVRVLSADERGAAPETGNLATNAVAALSQLNAWSVLDLPRSALVTASPSHQLLEWCDYLLLLTRSDAIHLAATHSLLARFEHQCPMSIVACGVTAKSEAAHISQMLAVPAVFTVRFDKSERAALEHGVSPGDRIRTKYARDVAQICAYIENQLQ